jgi:uncharacterized repeat protein (TIGR03803 family)
MHLRHKRTAQASLLLVFVTVMAGHSSAQGPVFTTLYEFKGGADGTLSGGLAAPNGVIVGNNGRLYGATYAGGINSCGSYACGTIYELTPASGTPWTKRVVHDFYGADGALPDANLVAGSNGALYGTMEVRLVGPVRPTGPIQFITPGFFKIPADRPDCSARNRRLQFADTIGRRPHSPGRRPLACRRSQAPG